MIQDQVSADELLARSRKWYALIDSGHFGAEGSEVRMIATGQANAYKEVAQELCAHTLTIDAAGIGNMCKVCGKALGENDGD